MAASLPGRGGKGRFGQRATRPMSDINVTPLVDVMLVLLVIFMITAPLLTSGVQVDLPRTEASAIEDQDKPIAVTIDRHGKVFIQDTEVTLDSLAPQLAAITQNNHDARVFVRGDQGIAYGEVMTVLSTVHSAGFSKVALLTQPLDSPPAPQPDRSPDRSQNQQP
ncbi:MAG: protein TolR [Defluviicoccus sp.]|nr:MAG: protein TolR [Defluviicoccus sp.]